MLKADLPPVLSAMYVSVPHLQRAMLTLNAALQGVFAVAGLWRDTPEWGPAYTMVMTEACPHVARRARPHTGDPQAPGLGRLARRPARRGGPAVSALSGVDGRGADP